MSPLGLESGTVRVVEYDPQWPALYAAEVARIQPFAPTLGFEHVGSTAVPGLCAKPVLDILAGHPQTASPLEFVRALERAGYEHRGDAGIPDHQFFRRGQPRAYHIHLVARDSALWRQYVGFRDYLRTDARARQEYDALKRALAERFPHDRAAYIERKSEFVREVIQVLRR